MKGMVERTVEMMPISAYASAQNGSASGSLHEIVFIVHLLLDLLFNTSNPHFKHQKRQKRPPERRKKPTTKQISRYKYTLAFREAALVGKSGGAQAV